MEFGLSRLGQIALTVNSIEPAIAFYRDQLGMKFLFQAGTLAFFDCGGVRLMLTTPEKPGESHNSILYFQVADMTFAHREMTARGVAFEGEPHLIAKMPDHDLWMAFFRDQDRNLLGLMCEIPRA